MKIDWFTFGAQVVNFIILIFLLKRFLYGRIIEAMDTREQRIAARFNEAQERERAADEEGKRYALKVRELDAQKAGFLARAQSEADATHREMIAAARQTVDAERNGWQASVRDEENAFLSSLREQVTQEVLTVARRVLADLVDTGLEERIIAVFLSRMKEIDEESRAVFSSASQLTVRSTFPLSDIARKNIADRVHAVFRSDSTLAFETAPGLISGIELRTTGRKVSWTIDRYLGDMETNIRKALASGMGERPGGGKTYAGTGA
jgi:F-type H+-transporting ATPase subunit b